MDDFYNPKFNVNIGTEFEEDCEDDKELFDFWKTEKSTILSRDPHAYRQDIPGSMIDSQFISRDAEVNDYNGIKVIIDDESGSEWIPIGAICKLLGVSRTGLVLLNQECMEQDAGAYSLLFTEIWFNSGGWSWGAIQTLNTEFKGFAKFLLWCSLFKDGELMMVARRLLIQILGIPPTPCSTPANQAMDFADGLSR